MLSQLHQVLLNCGYGYIKARHIPRDNQLLHNNHADGFYVKDYDTAGGIFKIALSFNGDPHLQLPDAYVLRAPEQYLGRLLPHINFGWYLCYVQEMDADWDPNDLQGTYYQVDEQILMTLMSAVASVAKNTIDKLEMEGEFASYWLGEKKVYILSEPKEGQDLQSLLAINELNILKSSDEKSEEWVAYHTTERSTRDEWFKQRKLTPQDNFRVFTRCFEITPSRLAGMSWPPENLRSLFKWLSDVDLASRNRILDYLVTKRVTRHLLLLDVHQQDIVALYIELNPKAISLSRHSGKKKHRKGAKTQTKHDALAIGLSSKHSCIKFTRLDAIRADREIILRRNRPRPEVGDLRTKSIALIGCGTIGGYLSGLLLRAGAGCGNANFHLYDRDIFSPQNFGRHSLNGNYFGRNKAIAVAESLKISIHVANKIQGFSSHFDITAENLERYDIIIDATGRPPVSKRLAKVVRSISGERRPVIVHGFNDGNGRASKVIVDDGICCYGCLQADSSFYSREGVDIRFKNIDVNLERHISCGSTYTPYDASVSVVTASMMQEAVLASLEAKRPWTYSEHMFDGSRSRLSRHLARQSECGICRDRG